jgi:hypothetical protein
LATADSATLPPAPNMPIPVQESAQNMAVMTETKQALTGLAGALQKAQEMGFEGLDMSGFGAFPVVRLHNGTYNAKEGMNLGSEFYGFIQDGGTTPKYVYNNGLGDKDPNRDFFYTYDHTATAKGEPVSQVLEIWKAHGWTPQISPYVDTLIKLHGGENTGTLIILSVPKASRSKLTVHIANIFMEDLLPSQTVTKFSIGGAIRSGSTEFTPMEFTIYKG